MEFFLHVIIYMSKFYSCEKLNTDNTNSLTTSSEHLDFRTTYIIFKSQMYKSVFEFV